MRNAGTRRPRWRFVTGPGDFMPILIGSVILFVSLPAFLLLLFWPDSNWGVIGVPLLVVLGSGIVVGMVLLVRGIQLCATPGSPVYRIAHGRIFTR